MINIPFLSGSLIRRAEERQMPRLMDTRPQSERILEGLDVSIAKAQARVAAMDLDIEQRKQRRDDALKCIAAFEEARTTLIKSGVTRPAIDRANEELERELNHQLAEDGIAGD